MCEFDVKGKGRGLSFCDVEEMQNVEYAQGCQIGLVKKTTQAAD